MEIITAIAPGEVGRILPEEMLRIPPVPYTLALVSSEMRATTAAAVQQELYVTAHSARDAIAALSRTEVLQRGILVGRLPIWSGLTFAETPELDATQVQIRSGRDVETIPLSVFPVTILETGVRLASLLRVYRLAHMNNKRGM